MTSRDLSADQLNRLRARLMPMRSLHRRLFDRALEVNLQPPELANAIRRATDAMDALDRAVIHARVPHRHAPHDPLLKPSDRA